MPPSHPDHVLLDLVAGTGHQMSELFLVGNRVFATPDPGSLTARSVIAPLEGIPAVAYPRLVDLLKRLDAVAYESQADVAEAVRRVDLWETIYGQLEAYLSGLPFAKSDGVATYYVVNYGAGQHKIECQAWEYFDPAVLEAIQSILSAADSDWEVILVGGPKLGPQQALSIYQNGVIKRWSTEPLYGDA
jgi:hypothetical protein